MKLFRIDWSVSGSFHCLADDPEEARAIAADVDIDPWDGNALEKEYPVPWPPDGDHRSAVTRMEAALKLPRQELSPSDRNLAALAREWCYTAGEETPEILPALRRLIEEQEKAERLERERNNGQLELLESLESLLEA